MGTCVPRVARDISLPAALSVPVAARDHRREPRRDLADDERATASDREARDTARRTRAVCGAPSAPA